MRGDIHRLRAPRDGRGREQQGARFAVIVQSHDLMLSTVLVAPTSRSAPPRIFRPTIVIEHEQTQVLVEQTTAVAPERLGAFVGRPSNEELTMINDALRLALELDRCWAASYLRTPGIHPAVYDRGRLGGVLPARQGDPFRHQRHGVQPAGRGGDVERQGRW